MTKISVVLYYWILVAATMLFAKTAGLADNNMAIIKILVVITILYVGVVMISHQAGKNQSGKHEKRSSKKNTDITRGKGKNKK